ncbi:hypothetical protein LJC28_01620 [Dysgonomonas sp. OttesenSCG-928-D17]|nr:hypothetical protein [Dysgonomonas sp. OttesenSCG-928-D17]
MKVKDLFSDSQTKVFVVTNQDDENELNWIIEPTTFELIPEEENFYFVKACRIFPNHIAAIEAFKISEAYGSSSHYIYLELSNLYKRLGQMDESIKYEEKFKMEE